MQAQKGRGALALSTHGGRGRSERRSRPPGSCRRAWPPGNLETRTGIDPFPNQKSSPERVVAHASGLTGIAAKRFSPSPPPLSTVPHEFSVHGQTSG